MNPNIVCWWDLAVWLERLAVNAIAATVLGSIQASSDTVESEGRQMKQCWLTSKIKRKNQKNSPFLIFLIKTHNTYNYKRQLFQHSLDKQKKKREIFINKKANCTPNYAYYMYSQKILAWYILNSFLLPPELPILSTPSEPTWNHRGISNNESYCTVYLKRFRF